MRNFLIYILLLLVFTECKETPVTETPVDKSEPSLIRDTNIRYAKRFSVYRGYNFSVIYLFGNRHNHDTTATFILYKDSTNLPSRGIRVKSPCKRVAALSSIYATMLCELGAANQLSAIDNIDYVNNPQIYSKYLKGELEELMKSPQIDLEKTVALKPDIIFTFGMGEGEKDKDRKLEQTGIPVAISVDHLEESPLARAEWIKFFAVFVNQEKQANAIFNTVEKNYFELKRIALEAETKPTVFNEIKYSDSWYMPGGKSYVAQLLDDAGADYLWKDDTLSGSLALSFEQVYAKAKDADFWINLSTLRTKKELIGFESRYSEFKAYKTGNLYNNTRFVNNKGYSIYWETGMIYPNRILSDLVQVFHPELREKIQRDYWYYEQLR